MPDVLFQYGSYAHVRSSCIRRRQKKSIFPITPSISDLHETRRAAESKPQIVRLRIFYMSRSALQIEGVMGKIDFF